MEILRHSITALRAVDGEAGTVKLPIGENVIAHPGHRQIRQDLLIVLEPFTEHCVACSDQDVVERQHDALGTASSAGGIQHDRQIGTATLRYLLIHIGWMGSIKASAVLLHCGKGMQIR